MPAFAQRRLSVPKAAALIYRTSKPTGDQVKRVLELIAAGELAGDARGTTAEAVADFIARASLGRQSRGAEVGEGASRRGDSTTINNVYRHSLKQYFLALILQHKVNKADRRFRQAVLAGQIAILLLTAVLTVASFRTIFPSLSPERAATIAWLKENTQRHRVLKWHPPATDDDGVLRMRVEYHYVTELGRGVDTVRIFTIAGNKVVSVDSVE